MSCAEHYFENLLFRGKDIKGEPNKNAISEQEQKTIEMCADYIIYSLFFNRDDFNEFVKNRWQD